MSVGSKKILRKKMIKFSFLSSSRNRYGPVKKDSPRSFSNCMDFIIKHRKQERNHFDWIKTFLGNLMLNPRPDQFDVLVNGFADHYQLTIYRFNCDNRGIS